MDGMAEHEMDPLARTSAAEELEERAERVNLGLDDPAADEVTEQEAILRRVPRIEVFLVLGALAGLILAMILTFAFPGQPGPNGEQYTTGQVFGFLALFLVPIGVGVLGLLGSFLGRRGRGEKVVLRRGSADEPLHADRDTVS